MNREKDERQFLLVMDVGNTNITFGIIDGEEIVHQWRVQTAKGKTSDEYGIELEQILFHFGYKKENFHDVIIGSVVPDLMHALPGMCRRFLEIEPMIVGDDTVHGMVICMDNPDEIGADRIVNAVAGYELYGGPLLIVDIGTAITHDVVSSEGRYLGGTIAPGVGIATEALFMKTSKLPKIELIEPDSSIGKNTVEAMQAGIVHGFIGLIDNIIVQLVAQLEKNGEGKPRVISTGGYSALLAQNSRYIELVDKDLTLHGLRMVYERTKKAQEGEVI